MSSSTVCRYSRSHRTVLSTSAVISCAMVVCTVMVCTIGCTRPSGPRIFGLFPVQSEDAGLAIEQRWGGICGRPQDMDRLNKLTRQIAAVVPELDVPCRCVLLRSEELAALSLSDGRVFLSRGLYEQSTDTQLAGIIAHEIAHIAEGDGRSPAADSASQLEMEMRADQLAIQYLTAAGLPIEGLAEVLCLVRHEQPSGWAEVRIRALNNRRGVMLASHRPANSGRFGH